jgi:hypothetical protein
MPQTRRRTSGLFGPALLPDFKSYSWPRRRVGFTHLEFWSLEDVKARYKAAEARVAVLHGRRYIRGMTDADVKALRAVPPDQRPRALKLAQEEMNVLREELRRRM